MKTAAAYIRVSTDDQTEYSPSSQLEKIREYAKRNDYILPDEYIFIDEGISGRTTKRPAFNQMIGIAKTKPKPFDAILLWKFSRFARNREDSIVYKSMLRKQCGIDVISISENIGDDKMSVIMEAMIEAMDEYYSINLGEEVRRGMNEKVQRGEAVTIPSFGYDIENGQYIPNPETAPVVRNIFADFLDGKGLVTIARELNENGYRTRRGNRFENRTVRYMLKNPVYIGKIRWTPTGKANHRKDCKDTLIIDGTHEPIISREIFDKVQTKLSKGSVKYMRENSINDEAFWSNNYNSSIRLSWVGLAFERVCFQHIRQIKEALQIGGVLSNVYALNIRDERDNGRGAQIDMIIDRKDNTINYI